MRIAPEGWPFIGIAWILLGAIALLVNTGKLPPWPLAIWVPVTIWVVAFFRDPQRNGVRGEGLILAPADGKVVSIRGLDEPAFIGGPATRISIFMNVFSVHVNRYPSAGNVAYRTYQPGRFVNAADEKASAENEQSTVGLDTPRGRLLIRQIAGLIARRIITDHQPGTPVRQGDRLGIIRFGSRVDLFVPAGTKVLVREGDHTHAALTVVAEWA